jgi:apolipoprotein N-acyltransferase
LKRPSAFLVPLAAALAAGWLQSLSIALPWNGQPQWWLQIASLAVLAVVVQRAADWKRAALLGGAFGTAWLCGTFWWLFVSMHTYGGLAAPLAVIAVVGLAAFLASYYAAACGVFFAVRRGNGWMDALLFASAWLFAELARTVWFTGFPWGAGGYAHVAGPLSVAAPYVGVHGIGFAAAALAFGLAQLVRKEVRDARANWIATAAIGALLATCSFFAQRAPATADASQPRLAVALLQGNIPQDEKFEPGTGVAMALAWYGGELQKTTASLVVTPETAIPMLPQQLPAGYFEALRARFTAGKQAALIGIPLGSDENGYANSVIGLKPDAPPPGIYRYDKHHLVPFGEFIPPLFKWFVRMMNIPLGDFGRGGLGQQPFEWQGERLAPNICYEDLFGEEIAANFRFEASAPTILVNLSNIGWFGDTVAIPQHLQISRMRALEFARPMIRATNTGATAIIDRNGRVQAMLQPLTRGVLTGEVLGGRGITPYAWWVSRTGLWPLWALCIVVLAAAAGAAHRQRPARITP